MLKYDEESLCKAFDKIVNPVISEIRKKVKNEIFSQIPKSASDRFYTDYTQVEKGSLNSNYIMSNNIIRKVVYFFELDIYDHENHVGYSINKIEKLIKNYNIPFKYGVDVLMNAKVITIGIKISELLKIDPDINKKSKVNENDIKDAVLMCINKKQNKLNKDIEKITKTKKINDEKIFIPKLYAKYLSSKQVKNNLYIELVEVMLDPEEYDNNAMNIINSVIQSITPLLNNIIPFKFELVLYEFYSYIKCICIKIDTNLQHNIDKTLSIINEAVQKYDEESIVKSAKKILGEYIKDIQSKIDAYLATQSDEVRDYIFKDYIARGEDWYDGYTIWNNTIGLYVYFYNPYDDYNGVCKNVIPNIKNIIKNAKLPIPFTVEYASDEQIPIEIRVKIDDLVKLDPSISRKSEISKRDACDIVEAIIEDKVTEKYITDNLKKIIRKYKIDDICNLCDMNVSGSGYYTNKYSIMISLLDYDVYTFSSRDPESPEFIKLMKSVYTDISNMLKQVIPFKFEIDIEWEENIIARIDYEDIKNNKNALKYIHENTNINSIFEGVKFI